MTEVLTVLALLVLPAQNAVSTAGASERDLVVGSWSLVSREDRSPDGRLVPEPGLGADPLGFLVYDQEGHVAAQLMRRLRSETAGSPRVSSQSSPNNSGATDGYDAYFGTYAVDLATHTVTHHLIAALAPGDVGKKLTRRFVVSGNELRLSFDTVSASGLQVVRTLVWRRISPR
jgi:hypothetical protein